MTKYLFLSCTFFQLLKWSNILFIKTSITSPVILLSFNLSATWNCKCIGQNSYVKYYFYILFLLQFPQSFSFVTNFSAISWTSKRYLKTEFCKSAAESLNNRHINHLNSNCRSHYQTTIHWFRAVTPTFYFVSVVLQ